MSTRQSHTPRPSPPPRPQAYNINIRRTFQLPASEPLGADWGAAELQALVGAPAQCAAAIQQVTGNADPEIAGARRAAAYAVSVADSLPEGEQRQAVLAALADAERLAREAAASAQLPATAVRAGKVGRRVNSRGEELRADGQRTVRPLLERAGAKRQALVAEEGVFSGDEFKKRARKGKATDKVGGWAGASAWPVGCRQARRVARLNCSTHLQCCRCAAWSPTRTAPRSATAPRTTARARAGARAGARPEAAAGGGGGGMPAVGPILASSTNALQFSTLTSFIPCNCMFEYPC